MAINQDKKDIIGEFDGPNLENISREHSCILSERIADYETNPTNVIDWEVLKREFLKS